MTFLSDYQFLQAYLTAEQWISATQNFIRTADANAYSAPTSAVCGDFIGQSAATAGLNLPLEYDVPAIKAADVLARGKVAWLRLRDTNANAKSVRVHILKGTAAAPPTVTSLDNAAIAFGALGTGAYIGFADVVLQPHPQGGSYGQSDLIRIPYELDLTSGSEERLWTFHEALTAFTPGNASTFYERLAVDRTR